MQERRHNTGRLTNLLRGEAFFMHQRASSKTAWWIGAAVTAAIAAAFFLPRPNQRRVLQAETETESDARGNGSREAIDEAFDR